MFSAKVKEGVFYVGTLNPSLRIFDIVMETKFGTSYNSYIVKGNEKTALIETCHHNFWEEFLANIEEVTEVKNIDYVILNHNEPDHTGCVSKLVDLNPNITIVTSNAGAIYIKNITNRADLNIMVAKDGDTLSLGDKTIKFINAPFLHWPDSMFSFLEEDGILFSCDFLGSHYAEPYIFDTKVAYPERFEFSVKAYYDAIFGPFKPYVLKGLEKIENIKYDMVCPSHGPILTQGCMLEYVKEHYKAWSTVPLKANKLVGIFYASAYGATKLLAEQIAKGIAEVHKDIEVQMYDIEGKDISQFTQAINECDALAVGSPTINKDTVPAMWDLLSRIDAISSRGKKALVFGSYGWSGEALPNIKARLEGLKYEVEPEFMRCIFLPSESELKNARAAGAELAKKL